MIWALVGLQTPIVLLTGWITVALFWGREEPPILTFLDAFRWRVVHPVLLVSPIMSIGLVTVPRDVL